MKCNKHQCDVSSSVGVCASCLRERLVVLVVAQSQAQTQTRTQSLSSSSSTSEDDQFRKSDPHGDHPPPLLFPRSVSPYVSRRKSDGTSPWSHHHHHHHHHHGHVRFYSTPQVGPTYSYNNNDESNTFSTSTPYKKRRTRFPFLSSLLVFKSRSHKPDPNPIPHHHHHPPPPSSPPRSSWFSKVFSSRKKNKQSTRLNSVSSCNNTRLIPSNRGMSPATDADCFCDHDPSPSGTGRSSFSEDFSKKTPAAASGLPVPARRCRPAAGHARSSSGLAFCLSPLVRASPNWHRNQKGGFSSDFGLSGEFRGVSVAANPHLSAAASFCANRSRKLADFGKVNHNR